MKNERVEISPEFQKCNDMGDLVKLINSSDNPDQLAGEFMFSICEDLSKMPNLKDVIRELGHNKHSAVCGILYDLGAQFNGSRAIVIAVDLETQQQKHYKELIKEVTELVDLCIKDGTPNIGLAALTLVSHRQNETGTILLTDKEIEAMTLKLKRCRLIKKSNSW